MEIQKAASSTLRFSVATIPVIANKLTIVQKKMFDEVWNYFVTTGKLFPIRGLPRVIGKQTNQEAFDGLNGCLIYETTEQSDRCFQLTAYGAFMTGHGYDLAGLLIRLLDLIKDLYEKDSFIKEIGSNLLKDQLDFPESEIVLLGKLLRLPLPPNLPFNPSGWFANGGWAIIINDRVIDLYRSEESGAYLDGLLSKGYDPNEPCIYEERIRYFSQGASGSHALPNIFDNQHFGQSTSPYINLTRIEALKGIKNTEFDCTRLICMCEELNECATRGNAHAVIMLTRAILDHVPPVFGFKRFKEVASNYGGGGSSFKKSVDRLENQSKKVADRLLHMPLRDKEVAPNMDEVSFKSEIETLLAEFCRLLK